jgi:hypothetical protein
MQLKGLAALFELDRLRSKYCVKRKKIQPGNGV